MGPILGPVVKHQRLLFSWFSFPAELMEVMSAAVTKKPVSLRGLTQATLGLTQATLVCGSHKAQLAMWGGSSAPRGHAGPQIPSTCGSALPGFAVACEILCLRKAGGGGERRGSWRRFCGPDEAESSTFLSTLR